MTLRVRDIPTNQKSAHELLVHSRNKQRRVGKNGWLVSHYDSTTKKNFISLKLYSTIIVRWWIQWSPNKVGIEVINQGIDLNCGEYPTKTTQAWINQAIKEHGYVSRSKEILVYHVRSVLLHANSKCPCLSLPCTLKRT